MKKGIILGLICATLLCGCGKVPKLKNGEEAVISFKKGDVEYNISANDLYEELKNNFGLKATVKMIDKYILETEFESNIDNAKKQAENYVKAMIDAYGGEEDFLEVLQDRVGYSSIEAYQDDVYISFMESNATKEYAKTLVTDKEIETYYKDEVKGDILVYHILLTPEVTDNMSDEEKTKAEDETKKLAKEIIKKLDDSKDSFEEFKKLVKEYSKDDASKEEDGKLGYINFGTLSDKYDELVTSAYKLKDGEYSKEYVTTELGYHIIYRKESKEKDTLENLKDKIVEKLSETKLSEDDIALNALKYYRKLYNMTINDSTLDRQYGIYLNNLANSN